MENEKFLNDEELRFVILNVLDVFENELKKCLINVNARRVNQYNQNENKDELELTIEEIDEAQFFIKSYYGINTFTFFTSINLYTLAESIFTNETLTSFILNVTDLVSIKITNSKLNIEKVIDTIHAGLISARVKEEEKSNSLIPRETLSSFYFGQTQLKEILTDNTWLLILYLILTNMENSPLIN